MGNILNHNFHNLRLKVNKDDYWDFFINKDSLEPFAFNDDVMDDSCLVSYIDAELEECVGINKIQSTDAYSWECSKTSEYDLVDIGFTGYDNGLLHYFKDRIDNRTFVDYYTKSTYHIDKDNRLKLHAVSGTHRLYDYPLTVEEGKIKLNGGFYQGFFMTEKDKYSVLPYKLNNGDTWQFEFVLKKEEFEKESEKTLNDKYPDNKGIFFYLGTRAENKWAYLYNKDDECVTWGIGDYVDGGDVPKNEYKLKCLLNANPDDFIPTELEEAMWMDDYITYKYYSPSDYGNRELTEDDFMLGDYVVMYDESAHTIDEQSLPYDVVGWCCNYTIEKREEDIRRVCCGCGGCRSVVDGWKTVEESRSEFFSKCTKFGDDYLSDIDDMEYDVDFIAEDLDISDFEYSTNENLLKIDEIGQYFFDTDNKFLMFDRTCNGLTVHTYKGDEFVRYYDNKYKFTGNLFLLMNRTCTGYTVHTIDELRKSEIREYNVYKDIYDNALAFRITDNGAIGYRYYTLDCDSETKTTVREGYSFDNVIKEGEWSVINVKLSVLFDTMVLRFYVNGKLVFVTDEMRKLNLRSLDEMYEKQETVPYNISLGGGTQGLAETVLPNYMLEPYRTYPLEEHFGGSFIGYIKSFKMFNCDTEYLGISSRYNYLRKRLQY